MASEYIYDEEGDVWPYFVLAILTFILVPLTVKYLARIVSKSDPVSYNKSVKGSISDNHDTLKLNHNSIKTFQKAQTSDRILNKTLVVLIVGWAVVFYVATNLTKLADMSGLFDPYEILGISSSASDKQIKSHYRKMSLKFHPDKMPKDLTEVEKEAFEQAYIRLTKAYKALTDEVTRENYLKFGHPDGRQDTTHGIALPKFLVEGKFSPFMIVFYFILVGVLLPVMVGSWWSNVKSHTSKGLHVDTAALFVKYLTDKNPGKVITPFSLLDLLCGSHEIKHDFNHLSLVQIKDLLTEYMKRETNSDAKLELDKLKIVNVVPKLIVGFIEIAVVFRQSDVVLVALDLEKSIIQAVKPTGKYKDLLQLPYVDPQVVEKQTVKKLGKLFTKDVDAAEVLGIKDEVKLAKAKEVAQKIASLRIIQSEFVVPGEKVVPPVSKAHLSLKFLIKSPALKSCPDLNPDLLKDEETIEYMKDPSSINSTQPQLPFSYCPYFPNDIVNSWSGVLINQRDNKLVEGSSIIKLTNADLSNVSLDQDAWIKGNNVVIGTLNVPLTQPTPQAVGTYPFRLVLKNNAYFGVDVDLPLFLEVKHPAPSAIDKDKLMGISKKDEDSDEDKEEETENDDDDESIFTDINTDTEDEDEDETVPSK
ncbi:translocation protein [Yamadazyma tenuis ATCC 10573]|uniref:Translocation protein n=1 Tax=Candida tenuis (strain ATCC 10573 / BCRC 21748 / CBS 615 / JCM 9827 / NBRC 10315 / NRRL Y-1498 / VKM Y-70) TaxID=590646 RepID=G3B3L8_CANTC|nr:translocation protein [Yamadazyma tenuis ATCC 10573]EGV64183.1 translocation protein [Yamadazyma tenuis ATCC 10573]